MRSAEAKRSWRLNAVGATVAVVSMLIAGFLLVRSKPRIRAESLFVEDARILAELEARGLSFQQVVGPDRLEQIVRTVERDMTEITKGQPPSSPRRPFKPEWLTRGRFELVGVVNRLDRRHFDPSACGEVRLVYRLALENPNRPATRLPMTVNVRIPQPKPDGATECKKIAQRWVGKDELLSLVGKLAPAEIEINYQSIHVPAYRKDMDDSAEYVLRAFEVEGRALHEEGLFNTPSPDVDKRTLLTWVSEHLREIDDGSAVLPKALLARRSVSVSPRGLTRPENRPYSAIVSARDLAELPLDELRLVRTPELLLRRLDESTCAGCHQTRGVAGFHLLGAERNTATFNALAVGHSPHFDAELRWRTADLASAARGEHGEPRPFAAHPDGELGSVCGLVPALSSWSCRDGLVCRDIHRADLGVCARPHAVEPSDPCEDVSLAPNARAEGPTVTASAPDTSCPAPTPGTRSGPFCAPNWLGFTGGVCTERCTKVGERRGNAICAPLPAAGYEAECFNSKQPVEACLRNHLIPVFVASCDGGHPCRADYGCARIPGAPDGVGACVPPYFIFQARVDGPLLDR